MELFHTHYLFLMDIKERYRPSTHKNFVENTTQSNVKFSNPIAAKQTILKHC